MNPLQWKYFTEGGANIIFRYKGSDPFYVNFRKNKVLRIPKKTYQSKCELVKFQPAYHNFICRNLGINGSIDTIALIKVESSEFLKALNQSSYSLRPEYRRLKYELDTSVSEILLLPDLLSEVLSCEIKPKWSGLKHHHRIDEMCSCRYCLSQISKGRRNPLNCSSVVYCPKLLFSNDKRKISEAITTLFDYPSNQFKLFIDSHKIEDDHLPDHKSNLIPILAQIIETDGIFQDFMRFQFDLLDEMSIESIKFEEVDLELYKSHLTQLSNSLYNSIYDLPHYLRVLMAMSVRDSSFIISITKQSNQVNWKQISVDSTIYYYKINIVDLDIKPIEKLEKYIEEIKLHG